MCGVKNVSTNKITISTTIVFSSIPPVSNDLLVFTFFGIIAIIVPPARKSRLIAALVLISFAASFVAGSWSLLAGVSSGAKTIALTVAISLAAALLFPVKDGEEAQA